MNTTFIIIWSVLVALALLGAIFFRSYSRRKKAPVGDAEKRYAAFLTMREFAYSDMSLDRILELFQGFESPLQEAIQAVNAGEIGRAKDLLGKMEGPQDVLSQLVQAKILLSEGDSDGAREAVMSLLKPDEESRAKVSAWAALRELGHMPSEAEARQVLGVVCEFELNGITALVAGYSDGDARLFTSKGFGMIGVMQQHPGITGAAKDLVKAAQPLVDSLEAADSRPIPEAGMIRFTVLTPGGMHSAYVDQSVAAEPANALYPVWAAMQHLLTEFRLMGQSIGLTSDQESAQQPDNP